MKKIANPHIGNEERAEMVRTVVNRTQNRLEADMNFGDTASVARKKAGEELRKLFIQAEAAQTGTTPSHEVQKTASVAPNVEAFFEKLSASVFDDAQRRYPELQKLAIGDPVKVPSFTQKKLPGSIPTRSPISGGSA